MKNDKRWGRVNAGQRAKVDPRNTAKRALLDPVTAQAVSNGARLDKGEFEVQTVPNPHGEVLKDGQPVQHLAVKRRPQYELLRSRKVISPEQAYALAWYAERLALAESGMVRNPLAGNGGGGSAGAGIPISEARMDALRDVEWARGHVVSGADAGRDVGALDIFNAVLSEDMTFVDAARRDCAKRYVRVSVRRRQDELKAQFVGAVTRLHAAYQKRFPQGPRSGMILTAACDGDHSLDQWTGR